MFNLKFCMMVDVYVLYSFIFFLNFKYTNLSVIKVGNTIRAGNTGDVLRTTDTISCWHLLDHEVEQYKENRK